MEMEPLIDWNPWWNTGVVPEVFKGRVREIDPAIFKTIKEREATILTGIRRAGKTTIMYQVIDSLLKENESKQILYLNLDDKALRNAQLEELYSNYRQNINPEKKAYLFLDEIQNAPDWERFIKKHYDLRSNIKFVISGSSAGLLKKEYSRLLTGRNFTFTIWPLSFSEYLSFSGTNAKNFSSENKFLIINKLNEYIEFGGFPEAYFKEKELKSLLLKQYFDDIIYKDVVSRYNINPKKITDLAIYLLTNAANQYTIRKIRNFTGLSIDSVRDYIGYLEDAYVVSSEQIYANSAKENNSPKKTYSIDTGLRNAVAKSQTKDAGRLVENIVYTQLQRLGYNPEYYKEKGEIDFIIKETDNTLTAINVSYTDEVNIREQKTLKQLKEKNPKTRLIILTKDTQKTEDGIEYQKTWKWLITKGQT
jgi:predicted AAA+ superfamily ATPase